jgi:hypothetical protein
MVSLIKTIIILLSSIIIISLLSCCWKNKNKILENFENSEYTNFYNLMTSGSINIEDRCLLAKQKIQDKKDGLSINPQIINAANNFINDNCKKKTNVVKKEKQPKINIDPKDKDAILTYYKNYCLPKYGELRDTVPFDNYKVEKDENNIQYFNGISIDKLELSKENCRRIEEYKKNEKSVNKSIEKPLSIDNLYSECLNKYSVQNKKVGAYNYYLSRDGKYYLNNEPLERIKLNSDNCRIIQDVMDKDKLEKENNLTITLDKLNEQQRRILCKRSNELDLICSVYNKDKVMEYGKNHDKEPVLYEYEIEPEKYEYSFLTPTEYNNISKNIRKGHSGLTADNEIDLCYRKYLIDKECNVAKVRKDI